MPFLDLDRVIMIDHKKGLEALASQCEVMQLLVALPDYCNVNGDQKPPMHGCKTQLPPSQEYFSQVACKNQLFFVEPSTKG